MIHNSYKCLNKQIFELDEYKLLPIRLEDRYNIMKWRNDQIFHLRQKAPLTKADQDLYFENIIKKQFSEDTPEQILFSFLRNEKCIGYGGLVHINWKLKIAEISFLISTELEEKYFEIFWGEYLKIIENVAFKELSFIKIFTFSYCIRPKLYKVLGKLNYHKEKVLKNITTINSQLFDARIDVKYSNGFTVKPVSQKDIKQIFIWVNEKEVRENSISSKKISFKEHEEWFKKQINNPKVKFFMVYQEHQNPLAVFRLQEIENKALISFSVSKEFRGKGIGSKIINFITSNYCSKDLIAEVLHQNDKSKSIFKNNGFKLINTYNKNNMKVDKFVKYSSI